MRIFISSLVIDRAKKNLTGSAFFDPYLTAKESDTKVNIKKMTLQQWQEEDKKNIAKRVHTSRILATLSKRDSYELPKSSLPKRLPLMKEQILLKELSKKKMPEIREMSKI